MKSITQERCSLQSLSLCLPLSHLCLRLSIITLWQRWTGHGRQQSHSPLNIYLLHSKQPGLEQDDRLSLFLQDFRDQNWRQFSLSRCYGVPTALLIYPGATEESIGVLAFSKCNGCYSLIGAICRYWNMWQRIIYFKILLKRFHLKDWIKGYA